MADQTIPDYLHSKINSIPEPGAGSLPYVVATTPARMVMQMAKATMNSLVNLANFRDQYDPRDPNAGGKMAADILNAVPMGMAPEGSVGVFGARLPSSNARLVRSSRGRILHETDDSVAKILKLPQEGQTLNLGEMLHHDELFDLYPELGNVKVSVDNKMAAKGGFGSYLDNDIGDLERHITINTAKQTPEEIRNSLLHETQHAVQDIDNASIKREYRDNGSVAFGTNLRSSGTNEKTAGAEVGALHTRFKRILETKPGLLSDQDLKTFERLNEIQYDQYGRYKAYRGDPGEVEAFTTGDRQFMTSEERLANPPNLKDASFTAKSGRVTSGDLRVNQDVLDPEAITERLNRLENGEGRGAQQQRVFGRRKGVSNASDLDNIDEYDRGLLEAAGASREAFLNYLKAPTLEQAPVDRGPVYLTQREFEQWRAVRKPKEYMGEVGDLYPKTK